MYAAKTDADTRKRAPSKRSLETRRRVFEAAEALFAERGFDGTSTRDIAARAEVTPALVLFHGQSKQALFESVVEARAEELARLRRAALDRVVADSHAGLREVIGAFVRPLLEKATGGDPGWHAYARLIALVSADPAWRALTERCFDPTVAVFTREIARRHPGADRQTLAAALVFSVSAMLSLIASRWRIDAMAGDQPPEAPADPALIETLVDYCHGGMERILMPG